MSEKKTVTNIGDFIKEQEALFKQTIQINGFGDWSFERHVEKASRYKNSQLADRQKGQWDVVKNITRPILNLQYRSEGFDVKDITIFVDDPKQYYKSFLVKKFHEMWARENGIDTVIDSMVESFVDYGGALLKNVNDVKPEVVDLKTVAFGDQRDLLSHPFGIKHDLSPAELLDMESVGWGSTNSGADITLEDLLTVARDNPKDKSVSGVPVYEVHGRLPKIFFDASESPNKYENYLFIVSFYTKQNGEKTFVTLFKGKEKKLPFKMIKRDPIPGRALGFGGAEELEESQVWTNYNEIMKQQMKEAASITLLGAKGPDSQTIAQKNDIKEKKNLSILDLGMSELGQIDTFPRNLKIFTDDDREWERHAQMMGAAQEAIMGETQPSGTPLGAVQIQQMENHSLHEYRKGKLATFWDEVERDWIVPHIAKAITKEREFLAELDLKELNYVADALVSCETNKYLTSKVLNGELIKPEDVEGYKEIIRGEFRKKGNKHFIKILEGELKGAPLSVRTNIVGKQKNLGQTVDKINAIVTTVLKVGGPAALASSATWDLINQSIEKSGLDPIDFSELSQVFQKMQQQAMAPQPQMPEQAQMMQ